MSYLSIIPKPVQRKEGISESWLPTPGDINVPGPLQKQEKGGFFRDLWGGIKNIATREIDKVKSDPLSVLQNIGQTMNPQDRDRIQTNIISSDPVKQQQAQQELIRYIQYLQSQQSRGIPMNTILIGAVILIVLLLIFRRK